jgi:hypothetical protein
MAILQETTSLSKEVGTMLFEDNKGNVMIEEEFENLPEEEKRNYRKVLYFELSQSSDEVI